MDIPAPLPTPTPLPPQRGLSALPPGTTDEQFDLEADGLAYDIRLREAARTIATSHKAGGTEPRPTFKTLDVVLAEPDTEPEWRIRELLPAGGNVVIVGGGKRGKTTLIGDGVRCIVDGQPFLGRFPTRAGTVAILDLEMNPNAHRGWLADLGIRNTRNVHLVNLRGRISSFNPTDPENRKAWADDLRGRHIDVLILDPLRPGMDSVGLDENHEAGLYLLGLDALKKEAGIGELIVVHHSGHGSERSRGDSRIGDWPDATWVLTRKSDDDPASDRFLSAFGRDVDLPEALLKYDPETRRLTLVGGNRQQANTDELIPVVVTLVADSPKGLSERAIVEALDEHPRAQVRAALKRAVKLGQLTVRTGDRGAHIHTLTVPDVEDVAALQLSFWER